MRGAGHLLKDNMKLKMEDHKFTKSAAVPRCVCGNSTTVGVVHRTDGPCFHYESAALPTKVDVEAMAEARAIAIYEAVHRDASKRTPWTYLPPGEWEKWRRAANVVQPVSAKLPSCGPSSGLDSETLVDVALQTYSRARWYETKVLHERAQECRTEIIRRLQASESAAVPEAVNTFITLVPHSHDRIIWRGNYYHLPLSAPSSTKPLTIETISRIAGDSMDNYDFARGIEAAHGITEEPT